MLLLVGTGVSYNDISMRAAEACRSCDVYIEKYTSLVSAQRIEYLERIIGKRIGTLTREALEEKARETVSGAASKDIAILVGGDPLTATTHKILLTEARKLGITVKIFHSSSIATAAIGESGLDFYRFGQVCTIPRWSNNYKPVSFYETIERNASRGLHSLVLLDYFPEKESTLPVKDAVAELKEAEASYKKGIISDSTVIFLMQDIGTDNQAVTATTIARAPDDAKGRAITMILPAKMSEIEEETVRGIVV
ncbi:MAG: diphthine synthase [Candidatus Marsarchaeota archaeon]|jgi:diphthine synthase|nr:diphthine synthase [Candidatus Marsarchaeota archaeon]MCL5111721.1 diphthine synthase [Candidatus Marsarchaeota archaeon]